MKTNKTLIAILASTIIFSLGLTSIYAYGGNGQGNGNGNGQGMHQGQQNGTGSGKNNQQNNLGNLIDGIEMQDLDSTEIDLLKKQYEEEMMANELYSSFYEMYGVNTFNNIASSEAQHMEAVKSLLDRYNIDVPTSYEHIQSLYDELKAKGSLSLKDALEVGISIEKVDLDDIITAIKSSDNNDIRIVLTNIGGASYNHMRGFVKALSMNNLTTNIDYSDYLTTDDLNTKGSIKTKLAKELELEGVVLPEQATSKYLQANCDNEGNSNVSNNGNQNISGSSNYNNGKQNSSGITNSNKSQSVSTNSKIKTQYKTKYSSAFSKLSDDRLNDLVLSIDNLSYKINNGDYSDILKEKYNSILSALRELAVENLD